MSSAFIIFLNNFNESAKKETSLQLLMSVKKTAGINFLV